MGTLIPLIWTSGAICTGFEMLWIRFTSNITPANFLKDYKTEDLTLSVTHSATVNGSPPGYNYVIEKEIDNTQYLFVHYNRLFKPSVIYLFQCPMGITM